MLDRVDRDWDLMVSDFILRSQQGVLFFHSFTSDFHSLITPHDLLRIVRNLDITLCFKIVVGLQVHAEECHVVDRHVTIIFLPHPLQVQAIHI